MMGYRHPWCEHWRSTASYSYVQLESRPEQGGVAYDQTHYAQGNLIWAPTKNFHVGAEYLCGDTEARNGNGGDDHRVMLSFQYKLIRRTAFMVPMLVGACCAGPIPAAAGAGGFTKGRETAPLTPEFKPGDYVWKPEVSPAGPVVIIVSIPEQTMFVYRNGVQIGRSTFVLNPSTGIRGSHVYSALARVDAQGRRDWLATTSIGGGKTPNVESLAALTAIPPAFLAKVRPLIAPGTTLVLTDLPVSSQTRSEQNFRILTTDASPSSPNPP